MTFELVNEASIRDLQNKLNQLGFGPLEPDGVLGPATQRALTAYELSLAEQPLPPKPWWKSRRMRGTVKTLLGLLAMVIPALANVNIEELLTHFWSIIDNAEVIIGSIGAILVLFGEVQRTRGAIDATAPIDKTLVTRIGNRDVRLPTIKKQQKPSNYLGDFGEE